MFYKVNLRVENWFFDTRLPFVIVGHFLYCWIKKFINIKGCLEEQGIIKPTVLARNSFIQKVIVNFFMQD